MYVLISTSFLLLQKKMSLYPYIASLNIAFPFHTFTVKFFFFPKTLIDLGLTFMLNMYFEFILI